MKKIIFSLALCTFILASSYAQTTMQASLGIGSTSRSVKIYIKTSAPIGAPFTISTLQFDIAIPDAFLPRPVPTITPNTTNFPGVTWGITNGSEGGYYHYMLTTAISPTYSKLDGTETEVMEVSFTGSGATNFSLVTLPDGGNLFDALFLCTSLNVNSDGSNLYYTRPGITVSNGFSYRPSGGLGTTTSFATISAPIVLPVKFTSFSATKKDNDALLNWTVENETASVDHYEVERSLDGTAFDRIITLAKDNSANTSKIYNSIDPNLSSTKKSGLIYYRIKEVDVDGRVVYSEIRSVRMGEKAGISLFPNPAKDFTNLSIDATTAGRVVVDIINADGKQLSSTTIQVQSGTNLKRIDTNNLPAGNYLVKIKSDNEEQIIKLIKL